MTPKKKGKKKIIKWGCGQRSTCKHASHGDVHVSSWLPVCSSLPLLSIRASRGRKGGDTSMSLSYIPQNLLSFPLSIALSFFPLLSFIYPLIEKLVLSM